MKDWTGKNVPIIMTIFAFICFLLDFSFLKKKRKNERKKEKRRKKKCQAFMRSTIE